MPSSLSDRALKRYPHGAMGGIYYYMMFKKKGECRIKSSRSNGNGEKIVTLVCKPSSNNKR